MTKTYKIKVYLIDCRGYGWEELDTLKYSQLLELCDLKELSDFTGVPLNYW